VDAFEGTVGGEAVAVRDVVNGTAGVGGKVNRLGAGGGVEVGGEGFEGLGAEEVEVFGQEVVVEDVDEDAAGVAVVAGESGAGAADDGVGVGEGVDPDVLVNSPLDVAGEGGAVGAGDGVGQEVAKAEFGVGFGEEEVGEPVHVVDLRFAIADLRLEPRL